MFSPGVGRERLHIILCQSRLLVAMTVVRGCARDVRNAAQFVHGRMFVGTLRLKGYRGYLRTLKIFPIQRLRFNDVQYQTGCG